MHLSPRFSEALVYACQLHGQQARKGSGIPYVSHLLSVAALALEHGASEDEAIAALLHDAIEDQGGPLVRDEIERRFGSRVAAIVSACTDAATIPKPPWRGRKEQYLAHLATADQAVRLVSAADKLHNVRSLLVDYRLHGDQLWERFSGGKDGTLWYYRAVVNALAGGPPSALVDELDRAVRDLERLVADSGA
jgi:GTP pyrophosphokinase